MYVPRTNQTVIYRSFSSPFITAILGARRVGKSTLVTSFAQQPQQRTWVFLNMDKLGERDLIESRGLVSVIEQHAQQKLGTQAKIWVAIDEAQKCPLLFEQIKVIYDTYKGQDTIKFILTGSGSLHLHQLSAESLAGRIELYYLREFSLGEAVALQDGVNLPKVSILDLIFKGNLSKLAPIIKQLSPFRRPLEYRLTEELVWGGLPEVLNINQNEQRLRYLANYFQLT